MLVHHSVGFSPLNGFSILSRFPSIQPFSGRLRHGTQRNRRFGGLCRSRRSRYNIIERGLVACRCRLRRLQWRLQFDDSIERVERVTLRPFRSYRDKRDRKNLTADLSQDTLRRINRRGQPVAGPQATGSEQGGRPGHDVWPEMPAITSISPDGKVQPRRRGLPLPECLRTRCPPWQIASRHDLDPSRRLRLTGRHPGHVGNHQRKQQWLRGRCHPVSGRWFLPGSQ